MPLRAGEGAVDPVAVPEPRGPGARGGLVVIGLWVALHLVWILRALAPGGGPSTIARRLPWNMFSAPVRETTEILARGRTVAGETLEIPLDDYFRFARGPSGQRLHETSRFLLVAGHRREREAFARWLAEQMAAAGRPIVEVVLIRRTRRILEEARADARVDRRAPDSIDARSHGRIVDRVIGRFPVLRDADDDPARSPRVAR